jgi:hypothetical protein
MKKILLLIAVFIGVWFLLNQSKPNVKQPAESLADTGSEVVAKTAINTLLKLSDIDATILEGISEKLEKSCAKNKYGLSEDDCIAAIRSRKDICSQQTAEKFPGQISDTDKMQLVVTHYVDCLFEKQ